MNSSLVLVGVVYAEFSKEAGPVPIKYSPQELSRDIALQVTVITLTSSFLRDQLEKRGTLLLIF